MSAFFPFARGCWVVVSAGWTLHKWQNKKPKAKIVCVPIKFDWAVAKLISSRKTICSFLMGFRQTFMSSFCQKKPNWKIEFSRQNEKPLASSKKKHTTMIWSVKWEKNVTVFVAKETSNSMPTCGTDPTNFTSIQRTTRKKVSNKAYWVNEKHFITIVTSSSFVCFFLSFGQQIREAESGRILSELRSSKTSQKCFRFKHTIKWVIAFSITYPYTIRCTINKSNKFIALVVISKFDLFCWFFFLRSKFYFTWANVRRSDTLFVWRKHRER